MCKKRGVYTSYSPIYGIKTVREVHVSKDYNLPNTIVLDYEELKKYFEMIVSDDTRATYGIVDLEEEFVEF